MDSTFSEVCKVVTQAVNMQHLDIGTLKPDTSLTAGGLGLDSVDILEVIVAVEHNFQVKVDNAEAGRKHFQTLGSIAEFVNHKKN